MPNTATGNEDIWFGFEKAFWVGHAHGLPSIAYDPRLNDRSVTAEAVYLRARFGSRTGINGSELPDYAKHCWFGKGLKLWASWDHENRAIYEIRTMNKHNPDEKGVGLICKGKVHISLLEFRAWCASIAQHNGLLLTLLDPDGEHCYEKLSLLIERFQMSLPDER